MAKRSIVGARELKTRLGKYLNRARGGETILVTDRGEPVAELRPVSLGSNARSAALHKLQAAGGVTLPTRRALQRISPITPRGRTGSEAVAADRDARG